MNNPTSFQMAPAPAKADSKLLDVRQWKAKLGELKTFRALRGHSSPTDFEENKELSIWVILQREQYRLWKDNKPSQLNPSLIQMLEEVGFNFEEDPYYEEENNSDSERGEEEEEEDSGQELELNRKWSERMTDLEEFRLKYGHCRVPRRYAENPSFGSWVHYIRRQARLRKQNRPNRLTLDQIKLLEENGFEWKAARGPGAASELQNRKWEERLEELKAFRAVHGHCCVPARYQGNERPSLGYWVRDQRQQYRLYQMNKDTRLTDYRVKALEAICFEWEAKRGPKVGSKKRSRVQFHEDYAEEESHH